MDEILIRIVSVLGNRDDVQALNASVGSRSISQVLDSLEKLALTWRRQGLVSNVALEDALRIISDFRNDVKESLL